MKAFRVILALLLAIWAEASSSGVAAAQSSGLTTWGTGTATTSTVTPFPGNTASQLNAVTGRVLSVQDFGAKCDGVITTSDGAISSVSSPTHFTSSVVTFQSGDIGKYISIAGAGATSRLLSAAVSTAGTVYAPQDTATDGTSTWIVATTQVVSATVAAAGTGGTTGNQTVTGTTGAGVKFTASVAVSGGAMTGVNSITTGGSYAQNPKALATEPVTGGGLTGGQLDVVMGANTVIVKVPGSYTNGSLPGTLSQSGSSGSGTGLVVTPTFGTNPLVTTISSISGSTAILAGAASTTVTTAAEWEYGTNDGAAINAGTSALSTTGGTLLFPIGYCFTGQTIVVYTKQTLQGDGPETSILHATSALSGALMQSYNFASLVGTNSSGGVEGVSLRHMRFDGNAPYAPSVTDVIDHYGYRPFFEDIQVWNAQQRNIWTEWGTSGGAGLSQGASLEGQWERVTSYQTVGYGTDNIYHNGPHDSRSNAILAINAGQAGGQGIWMGAHSSGMMMTNSHVWATAGGGEPQWSFLLNGGAEMLTNTTGEGSSVGPVKMTGADNSITGGFYYRNPQDTNSLVCFQIGDGTAGLNSSLNNINTVVQDCEGGVVYFDDDNGRNMIHLTGSVADASSTMYLGIPSSTDVLDIRVFNDSTPNPFEYHTGTLVFGSLGSSGVAASNYTSTGLTIEASGATGSLKFFSPSAVTNTQTVVFGNPLNAADGGILYNSANDWCGAARTMKFRTAGNVDRLCLDNVDNVLLAGSNGAAVATNATGGFFFPSVMNGAPSGTPGNHYTGATALVYDYADHELWSYEQGGGAWRGVYLNPTTPTGILRSYHAGWQLSNDATTPGTKIDVAAGAGDDSTHAVWMQTTGSCVVNFGGANGAAALDTGAQAASTWYGIFVIYGSSGTSCIATTPTTWSSNGVAVAAGSTAAAVASTSANITNASTVNIPGAGPASTGATAPILTTTISSVASVSVTPTGTTTNTSNSITSVSSGTSIVPGLGITDSDACIPAGTVITAYAAGTATLSQNTNASGCGAADTLTITGTTFTLAQAAETTVGATAGTTSNTLVYAWGVSSVSSNPPFTPAMPAGYTYYRYVGSVFSNGSTKFSGFTQKGHTFTWALPTVDANAVAFPNASTSAAWPYLVQTLTIPQGVPVRPIFRAHGATTTLSVLSPYEKWQLEQNSYNTAPGYDLILTNAPASQFTALYANELGQIVVTEASGSSTGTFSEQTRGWWDDLGDQQ